MDGISFLGQDERKRQTGQPVNSLGETVNGVIDNTQGNNYYVAPWANQQQPQEEEGYFDAALKGVKAQAAGVFGGQADFVSGTLGTDGQVGDYLQGIARANQRNTNYDVKDILANPIKYITDPSGLTYDLGGAIGSSGALGLETAALMAALPSGVTAGITGVLGASVGKALPWLADALKSPAGKILIGNILKTPMEAVSEGGNVYREMTRNEDGTLNENADTGAARRAMYSDAALNSALLTFTNTLESAGLGGLINSSGGKSKVLKVLKGAAADFLQNGYEEGAQQGISQYTQGKGTARQILDPTVWTPEQNNEAFIGGITGAVQGGGMTAGGMVANKMFGNGQTENQPQEQNAQQQGPVQQEETQQTQGLSLVDRVRDLEGKIPYEAEDGTNCMRTMGIALAGTPYEGQINVDQAVATARENGQLMSPEDYVPRPGDLAVVNDGNHIVMVTENGGTIQNGASHNGVYEKNTTPAEMFGGVKYYIRTSDYNGSLGEYNPNINSALTEALTTPQDNSIDQYLNSMLGGDTATATAIEAMNPEAQQLNEALQNSNRAQAKELLDEIEALEQEKQTHEKSLAYYNSKAEPGAETKAKTVKGKLDAVNQKIEIAKGKLEQLKQPYGKSAGQKAPQVNIKKPTEGSGVKTSTIDAAKYLEEQQEKKHKEELAQFKEENKGKIGGLVAQRRKQLADETQQAYENEWLMAEHKRNTQGLDMDNIRANPTQSMLQAAKSKVMQDVLDRAITGDKGARKTFDRMGKDVKAYLLQKRLDRLNQDNAREMRLEHTPDRATSTFMPGAYLRLQQEGRTGEYEELQRTVRRKKAGEDGVAKAREEYRKKIKDALANGKDTKEVEENQYYDENNLFSKDELRAFAQNDEREYRKEQEELKKKQEAAEKVKKELADEVGKFEKDIADGFDYQLKNLTRPLAFEDMVAKDIDKLVKEFKKKYGEEHTEAINQAEEDMNKALDKALVKYKEAYKKAKDEADKKAAEEKKKKQEYIDNTYKTAEGIIDEFSKSADAADDEKSIAARMKKAKGKVAYLMTKAKKDGMMTEEERNKFRDWYNQQFDEAKKKVEDEVAKLQEPDDGYEYVDAHEYQKRFGMPYDPKRDVSNIPEMAKVRVGRKGRDFRKGKDVSVKDITTKFALLDVTVDDNPSAKEKQALLNQLYDALSDLVDFLNVGPTAISLGGKLSIIVNKNFHNDSTGGNITTSVSPYYNPVIRLSSKELRWGGSLAHEWFHGLDNWFGKKDYEDMLSGEQTIGKIAKGMKVAYGGSVRKEVVDAFVELRKTIIDTEMEKRGKKVDGSSRKKYWSAPHEMMARSFSSYLAYKLKQAGHTNNYLTARRLEELSWGAFPEVREQDMQAFVKAYDKLFATLKTKEEIGGGGKKVTVFYSAAQTKQINRSFLDIATEIKKAFPNAKFSLGYDGKFNATLPNGSKFAIDIKNRIVLNETEQKNIDAANSTSGAYAQGSWARLNGSNVERLLTIAMNSQLGTTFHEAMHAAIDMALLPREKNALYKYYEQQAKEQGRDVEEVIADAYRDWVLAREEKRSTRFGKLWQKIKDFATRIKSIFDKSAEIERIMQDVESGKVYERGVRNENNQTRQDNIQYQNTENGEQEKGQASQSRKNQTDKIDETQKLQEDTEDTLGDTITLNAVSARDESSREYMTNVMRDKGMTDNEIADLFNVVDSIVDSAEKIAKDNGFKTMEDWLERNVNDPNLLYRVTNEEKYKATFGHIPTRSSFKKNGEYELNIDLGALCTKRESMDALVYALSQQVDGAELIQNLGPTQMEALKSMLKEEGFLTACDVCFVETKRVRALNDANKWAFEWKTVLQAAGIDDNVKLGERESLTPEQLTRLNELAGAVSGVTAEDAFNKYIANDEKLKGNVRQKVGKDGDLTKGADLDSGITSSKAQKIAKLILEDTRLAGDFDPSLLLTTHGTDYLVRTFAHTNIANTIASMYGAATAKPLEGFNIYDALSWYKDFDSKNINMQHIYDIGGFRAQSFTDFNPILFVDYVQMFADLQARQLPIHLYTKVPSLVEIFGRTGAMINMSLVPEIVDGAPAGLDRNGNYAWAKESFPVDKAMELRKREDFGGRVGTIAVGVSDEHILKMLDDEEIDYIIPYHSSGMPAAVKTKTGLNNATDYTKVQETKKPVGWKENENDPERLFNSYMQEYKDARKAANAYKEWCKRNGCTPKFERFSNHPNYYKVLEDFRAYDNNGNPVIQGPVKMELTDNWQEVLKEALADRTKQANKINEMATAKSSKENGKKILDRAREILAKQRLDSDAREVMISRLNAALGKQNVQCLKQKDFLDQLEKDGGDKNQVELFRNSKGICYGYAKGNRIVLNENVFNADTPAHEFSHIWANVAQRLNPELWRKGVELLKKDAKDIWDSVVNDPLYQNLKDDNAIADEVLARITGGLNESLVREMTDPNFKMSKAKAINLALYNVFGNKKGNKPESLRLSDRLMNFLKSFFTGIRNFFKDKSFTEDNPLTYDEFIRMPLKTLWNDSEGQSFKTQLNKLNRAKELKSGVTYEQNADIGAGQELAVRQKYEGTDQWMKAPNGKKTKLTEKQWLQVRTPAFKKWFGDWENSAENKGALLDENGEPRIFYRGISEEYDPYVGGGNYYITWLTNNYNVAERYRKYGYHDYGYYEGHEETLDEFKSRKQHEKDGEVLQVYSNAKKFYEIGSLGKETTMYDFFENKIIPAISQAYKNGQITSEEAIDLRNGVREYEEQLGFDEWGDSRTMEEWHIEDLAWPDFLQAAGYDGVTATEKYGNVSYCIFGLENVKSADKNNGEFSSKSEDIRYSAALTTNPIADVFTNTEESDSTYQAIKKQGAVAWFKEKWDGVYRDWVDKNDALHGLDQAFATGMGLKKLSDKNSIYNRVQTLSATTAGEAQSLVEGDDEHIRAISNKLGLEGKDRLHLVSIKKVLQTIDAHMMDRVAPDFLKTNGFKNWVDAFGAYLGSRRLLEMARISEEAGEEYTLPKGVTKSQLEAYVNSVPKQFKTAATQYYLVNDNVLKIMENAGLISKELHEILNTKYKEYCPLMRDFSDTAAADTFIDGITNGGRGIANVSSMLKKISITGSERGVLNPLESTVKAISVAANRCERNRVGQMAADMVDQSWGKLDGIIKRVEGEQKADPKNMIFTVMRNGKKEAYQVQKEYEALYSPIVGYNVPAAGLVLGVAQKAAHYLRTGATMSPSFIVRNFLRDQVFAGVSSQNSYTPIIDGIRGMIALWSDQELRAKFEAAGVTSFDFYNHREKTYKDLVDMNMGVDYRRFDSVLQKLDATKPFDTVKALLKYPELWSEFIEASTRMGEFKKALDKGMTLEEASRAARELTLDFSRSGVHGENVNKYIPFFNACIQGGDKLVRLFRDNPINTSVQIAKYIVLPSMFLWALNHDKDWYKELDAKIKNSYWCLPGGLKIPKPQEAGVLFGSGIEAMLDYAFNKDKRAMTNWKDTFIDNMAPGVVPTLVMPILEWKANYSYFTGNKLVSRRLERLPDEEQYNNGTSYGAKAIGRTLKLSPVKIDNLIRGYTGTMGMFLWQTGDMLEGKNEPKKYLNERQFIRDFNVTQGNRSRYTSEFYDLLEAANKFQSSSKGVKGKPPEDVKRIRKMGTVISDLNKDIQKITDSKTLSAQRKRELIDNKKQRINQVAKRAVEQYGDKYL